MTDLYTPSPKYGRLTIIGREGRRYVCTCDCGSERPVKTYLYKLKSGHTQSCGCLQRERAGNANRTHGKSHWPEYRVWVCMWRRCCNPRRKDYRYYGGRGISVCERWRQFENFIEDMGRRPFPEACIDRIDNNGDYTPDNCRWATVTEQNNNCRQNVFITYSGRTQTMAMWSRELRIPSHRMRCRKYQGCTGIAILIGKKRARLEGWDG